MVIENHGLSHGLFFRQCGRLDEKTMGTSMEKRLFFPLGKSMVFVCNLSKKTMDSYGKKFSMEIAMVFVSNALST